MCVLFDCCIFIQFHVKYLLLWLLFNSILLFWNGDSYCLRSIYIYGSLTTECERVPSMYRILITKSRGHRGGPVIVRNNRRCSVNNPRSNSNSTVNRLKTVFGERRVLDGSPWKKSTYLTNGNCPT